MFVGYLVGENEALVKHYLGMATIAVVSIILIGIVYVYRMKKLVRF